MHQTETTNDAPTTSSRCNPHSGVHRHGRAERSLRRHVWRHAFAALMLLLCAAPQRAGAAQLRSLLQARSSSSLDSTADVPAGALDPEAPAAAPKEKMVNVESLDGLRQAVNVDGIPHVVIKDHLASRSQMVNSALLKPRNSTMVIRVRSARRRTHMDHCMFNPPPCSCRRRAPLSILQR